MRRRPAAARARTGRRLVTDSRGFAWLALAVVGALTAALWLAAATSAVGAATRFGAVHGADGRVVSCSDGVVRSCTVSVPDEVGVPQPRPLSRPGLLGVAPGDVVPVWVDDAGRVSVGGWRPWFDAALLTALALAATSGALTWLGRVLRHGDTPYTPGAADLAGLDDPGDVARLPLLDEWRPPTSPAPTPPPPRPLRDGLRERRPRSHPPRR